MFLNIIRPEIEYDYTFTGNSSSTSSGGGLDALITNSVFQLITIIIILALLIAIFVIAIISLVKLNNLRENMRTLNQNVSIGVNDMARGNTSASTASVFCPNCGNQYGMGLKTCPYCGTKR